MIVVTAGADLQRVQPPLLLLAARRRCRDVRPRRARLPPQPDQHCLPDKVNSIEFELQAGHDINYINEPSGHLAIILIVREGTEHGFPTSIVFKENPGGEFRKSYHGYPSGK